MIECAISACCENSRWNNWNDCYCCYCNVSRSLTCYYCCYGYYADCRGNCGGSRMRAAFDVFDYFSHREKEEILIYKFYKKIVAL